MDKLIATNRRARHEYHILETYEAGIVLCGPEVKSVRSGHVTIHDAFVRIDDREAFIHNMYIAPYAFNQTSEIDSYRTRKLLLKKKEIGKLAQSIAQRGFTIIPLRLYFFKGYAKLEIAVARGKQLYDKREDIKERDIQRGIQQRLKTKLR